MSEKENRITFWDDTPGTSHKNQWESMAVNCQGDELYFMAHKWGCNATNLTAVLGGLTSHTAVCGDTGGNMASLGQAAQISELWGWPNVHLMLQTNYSLITSLLHFKKEEQRREATCLKTNKIYDKATSWNRNRVPTCLEICVPGQILTKAERWSAASWFCVRKIVNTWQSSNKTGSNCSTTKYVTRSEDAYLKDWEFGGCAVLTELLGWLNLRENAC